MTQFLRLSDDARHDLWKRGYSRRDMGRIAAVFGAGAAAAAAAGRPAWAASPAMLAGAGIAEVPGANIFCRIGANECWTGPFAEAAAKGAAAFSVGNRYEPGGMRDAYVKTASAIEGVPEDHIAPWPGSSDPLSRTVVTFASPARGLVTADPTFELSWRTADFLGVPVAKVPLSKDLTHDVRAMLAANPDAGMYYICSPNNPSGRLTPIADIEWLIANKPAGSVVVVDEAYIHFAAKGTPTAAPLVAAGKDVVVLRTFSKLFGMAGLRMGMSMARPDLLAKMMRYDGAMQSGSLPLPSLVCATVSLTLKDQIDARRAQMIAAKEETIATLDRMGVKHLPSDANFFMIDWQTKKAKDMQMAFRAKGIEIGRSWPIWPTVSRVTVGSASEMKVFTSALKQVLV